MDKMKKLIDEYIEWARSVSAPFKLEYKTTQYGEYHELTCMHHFDHLNDAYQIYVKLQSDGQIYITDDGYILSNLEMAGIDMNLGSKARIYAEQVAKDCHAAIYIYADCIWTCVKPDEFKERFLEFELLLDKIDGICNERDDIIHGWYGPETDPVERLKEIKETEKNPAFLKGVDRLIEFFETSYPRELKHPIICACTDDDLIVMEWIFYKTHNIIVEFNTITFECSFLIWDHCWSAKKENADVTGAFKIDDKAAINVFLDKVKAIQGLANRKAFK